MLAKKNKKNQYDIGILMPDENANLIKHIIHLSRLGLAGSRRDVELYIRRMMRVASKQENSALVEQLSRLIAAAPTEAAPLREVGGSFVPVDRDSRLQLLRHENPVVLDHD